MKEEEKEKSKNTSLVLISSKELIRLKTINTITNKLLNEHKDRSYIFSWYFLINNSLFFKQFFATNYSFTESELINFYKKIDLGYEFMSPSVDEPLDVGRAHYGLSYNKNIFWSERIKFIYEKNKNVFMNGYYIKDFSILPLDIKKQVDFHRHFEQQQNNYFSDNYDINSKVEKYYEDIFNKKEFTNLEILDIIKVRETDYFCNHYFVNQLNNKIYEDIKDFEISKFYSNLKLF